MIGRVSALAVLLVVASLGPAFAASCKPVDAAWMKSLELPRRETTLLSIRGGQTITSLMIWIDGRLYTHHSDGSWTFKSLADGTISAYAPLNGNRGPCSRDGSDRIGHDVADIYIRNETGRFAIDERLWISRASGLVLRTILHTDQVEGGITDAVVSYDYRDIQLPPEARDAKPE